MMTTSGTMVNAGNTPSVDTQIYVAPIAGGRVLDFARLISFGMVEGKGQRTLNGQVIVLNRGPQLPDEGMFILLSYKDIFGSPVSVAKCVKEPPLGGGCGENVNTDSLTSFVTLLSKR